MTDHSNKQPIKIIKTCSNIITHPFKALAYPYTEETFNRLQLKEGGLYEISEACNYKIHTPQGDYPYTTNFGNFSVTKNNEFILSGFGIVKINLPGECPQILSSIDGYQIVGGSSCEYSDFCEKDCPATLGLSTESNLNGECTYAIDWICE
jgi:hypothetical protein